MKKNLICSFAFSLALAVFAACGAQKVPETVNTADTASITDKVSESPSNKASSDAFDSSDIADNYTGIWADQTTGRGVITISAQGNNHFTIDINWNDSANTCNLWTMTATLEENQLSYNDAVSTFRTYETEEKFTDEVQNENGIGRFYLNENQELIWETEGADEGIIFIKVG